MLAVHLNQRALEAVCLTLERDDLLLGQLDVIAALKNTERWKTP